MSLQKSDKVYSPHDQLPAPEPTGQHYPVGYFYENTARHLIKDAVRIMDNGLAINIDKVVELEQVLEDQIDEIDKELEANPLIQEFIAEKRKYLVEEYIKKCKSSFRDPSHYLTEFKPKDMTHRSYFMHVYAKAQGWGNPSDTYPSGVSKWPAKLVKKYAKTNRLLQMLLDGTIPQETPAVVEAMKLLALHKADTYNEKYVEKVKNPQVPKPKLNPGSAQQKQQLFDYLGIESETMSKKTGLPSWDRDEIERVNRITKDENVKKLTQSFIDYSFAAIVRNNFIAAFYTFTVEDRLYGQYKLLGAKTGRFTSSSPNMLNMPSTRSRFAKPVKRCFVAPEGKIILAADYSALEDRVIACLSRDVNKCNIFLKGLDGHSLNALGYFNDEIAEIMDITGDMTVDATMFKSIVDDKNPIADAIRQKGKPVTFGLSYGAYPPKIAKELGISVGEAQEIFDNYHNVLYPGITEYREDYVLATALEEGEIHLGLGFIIKSDDPESHIRTLANATCQFWSILTALTINKMHILIDEAGYEDDVKVISTIYDSIYFEVTENPVIIKWVNDNLIDVMSTDFMEDQIIQNEAESDIGYNWADMLTIPNKASVEQIAETLEKLAA
ncbi:DNA polymerase [Alteromonas phage vB_AmaP_AD45-P2]|uniref:DNA-directed DNA polymerase n=3 Tax=Pseudomonadota TaxID=1224 RepID=A0A922T5C5_9HYPH|nr:DNA polymerase [Alteromonas phage vB_AmaP_AD45-P1]AGM46929.1 DNA polymerase [Alteromonas phage vB_AmaP_AD45-P1]AGM47162.1 DNA polymerase [Alteromonas phage vB_AmaP_AD45-P4]AGM47284.1 DNA polymerase [Alteromonas phage vB_AmaP_AD45-P2]KEQ05598.1 hypothetical protein GV68_08700 [Pseudorhizobium pelagicum]